MNKYLSFEDFYCSEDSKSLDHNVSITVETLGVEENKSFDGERIDYSEYQHDLLSDLIQINKKLRVQVESYHKILSKTLRLNNEKSLLKQFNNIESLYLSTESNLVNAVNSLNKKISIIPQIIDLNSRINQRLKNLQEENEALTKNNYNLLKEKSEIDEKNQKLIILNNENLLIIKENEQRNKNLVDLVNELEKKHKRFNFNHILSQDSSSTNKCKNCLELVNKEDIYNDLKEIKIKMEEKEKKYKSQLLKKDEIIQKLDSALLQYENKLSILQNN